LANHHLKLLRFHLSATPPSDEMLRAKQLLDSVKDSIINAYEIKTGLPRTRLSQMMDAETDMPAQIAVALGFADEILFQSEGTKLQIPSSVFSPQTVLNSLLDRMRNEHPLPPLQNPGIHIPAQRKSIIANQIF
jgi:ATP-dependent Clp protease protease subunit